MGKEEHGRGRAVDEKLEKDKQERTAVEERAREWTAVEGTAEEGTAGIGRAVEETAGVDELRTGHLWRRELGQRQQERYS